MSKADQREITKNRDVRAFGAGTGHEIPSMTELPPPNTRRWVPRRKAAVVAAVSSGMITIGEACGRYHMSEEELFAWQRAFEDFGIRGLRARCIRQQRGLRLFRAADP
jgi:transposase-like protein